MAVNWGLGQGGGFDYLESLQALGNVAAQRQGVQQRDYAFRQAQAQDRARAGIQQQAASGDFSGAAAQAFTLGDYDALKYVQGLEGQHHAQLAKEADIIGRLATSLKGIADPNQRMQAFAAVAPQLRSQGFSDDELHGVNLSDGALDQYIALATDTKTALEAYAKAQQPFNLSDGEERYGANGQLIARNARDPKWQFDSESGSWLQEPGTGGASVMPQAEGGDPSSAADTFSRMVGVESGNRQFTAGGGVVTSPKGATGIAQVMPATGPEAARLAGLPWDPQRFRSDPAYNRALGEAYYQEQRRSFGDEQQAVAAYNAGPGRVRQAIERGGPDWQRHIPRETQDYLAKVFGPGQAPQGRPVSQPGVVNVRPPKRRDAPSGYEWSGDGSLRPIRGGPADPSTPTSRNVQSDRKSEADLRKEFNGRQEIKGFGEIRAARERIRAITRGGKSLNLTPQDDIALIFSYMKMLDPGSVVRESEFANAQNAAGVPDQLRNLYNRTIDGNRINSEQRRNIISVAERLYTNSRETYNRIAGEYRGYAGDYGISPDRVARRFVPDAKPTPKPGNERWRSFKVGAN